MKTITYNQIESAVESLVTACSEITPSCVAAMEGALERETDPNAKTAIGMLLENAALAKAKGLAVCQDTGMAVFFVRLGQDVHIEGGLLQDAIDDGVRAGYAKNGYRASVLDPISRKNTKDNTPAIVHIELVLGDKLEITFLPKGFGSENMSRLFMLKPSQGVEGIKDCVVQAVKEGAKRPVTVKMRAGVESGKPVAVECALAAQKGGASAVCVHPRYREQFYSGEADHSITKAVKEALDIPVIANGDITDLRSLAGVRDLTGADGFMIGRGALGRPWIFSELNDGNGAHDVKADIYEHIAVLRKYMCDFTVANVMKLQLCYYAKGGRDAKAVRVEIGKAKSIDDIFDIVEKYFA